MPMSSRDPRLLAGYAVTAVLVGVLGVSFGRALAPALKREKASPCAALDPSPYNEKLGRLPVLAPAMTAKSWDGKDVGLEAYRGRVVFLNFWADWCPPCLDEMPSMDALQKRLGGAGFTMLAVGSGTTWESIRKTMSRLVPGGSSMTFLLDPDGEDHSVGPLANAYGTKQLPETFLIDKQGVVRYYFVNKRDWSSTRARQCLDSLLEE